MVLRISIISDECPICTNMLADGTWTTLRCGHKICTPCWNRWVNECHDNGRAATCPMCRNAEGEAPTENHNDDSSMFNVNNMIIDTTMAARHELSRALRIRGERLRMGMMQQAAQIAEDQQGADETLRGIRRLVFSDERLHSLVPQAP